MDATQKIAYPNMAEAAKKKGWKVGILRLPVLQALSLIPGGNSCPVLEFGGPNDLIRRRAEIKKAK